MTLSRPSVSTAGSTMCTCPTGSPPSPTYPLSAWRRSTPAWRPDLIRFVNLHLGRENIEMFLQMRGSQVIARRAMPKGYPRELENCNKIFLCSQSGKVEEDKGLDDSIDDKVNIFCQRGSEIELNILLPGHRCILQILWTGGQREAITRSQHQ